MFGLRLYKVGSGINCDIFPVDITLEFIILLFDRYVKKT